MTNSSNITEIARNKSFKRLAFLALTLVYLVILAGAVVRGTGSGMGCPDWPKCFGRWVPPTDISQLPPNYQEIYGAQLKGEIEFNATKTWIEYSNRLVGALSGIAVFVLLISSIRYWNRNRAVFWGSLISFLFVGLNGWFGSRVVASELAAHMITIHMLLAIVVVFALLFVLHQFDEKNVYITDKKLYVGILVVILLTLIQVVLGTEVRDALDVIAKRLGEGKRAEWVAQLNGAFYIHRSFSLLVLVANLWIVYRIRKVPVANQMRQLQNLMLNFVLLGIATGVILSYLAVPTLAQPLHLVVAIGLLSVQFMFWLKIFSPKSDLIAT